MVTKGLCDGSFVNLYLLQILFHEYSLSLNFIYLCSCVTILNINMVKYQDLLCVLFCNLGNPSQH